MGFTIYNDSTLRCKFRIVSENIQKGKDEMLFYYVLFFASENIR